MPFKRFRRNRQHPVLRELLSETRLHAKDFIYPLFVVKGQGIKCEISSMPDVYQMSIDEILKECATLTDLGIEAIMLFGIPHFKDDRGSEALSEDSIISQAIKAIKKDFPNMLVISDLCFCEYTDHGHCGLLDDRGNVDNDKTLELLAQQALVHLQAGVDVLAPSGMMDGVVGSLRGTLDTKGYSHIPIMSYSTKFASSYYGPFRDVAQCAPSFGDRRGYQMNPANSKEAVLESVEDAKEQSDILMVKPALAYLDIIYQVKQKTHLPLAVYNVSGEYAMLKMAGQNNLIDYDKVLIETMIGFKRAGADIIISYHAKEVVQWLNDNS